MALRWIFGPRRAGVVALDPWAQQLEMHASCDGALMPSWRRPPPPPPPGGAPAGPPGGRRHLLSSQVTDLSKGADPDRPTQVTDLSKGTDPHRHTPGTHSHTQTPTEQGRRLTVSTTNVHLYTRAPVHKHHGRHMMELTPKPNIPFTGFLVRLRTVMRTMWLEVGHGHHLSHHGFEQRDGKAKSAPTNRLPCLWR